jgi:glycine oxidase
MSRAPHATIVGGGVIGLSIAWELAGRGFRVTLIESDEIGRGTSRAGTGILPAANLDRATDPIDRLRGLSHRLFPQWIESLQSITGIDCGFRRCGGWYLADTRGEQAAMLGMTGYWDELGIDCQPVPLDRLSEREPFLTAWADRSPHASAWWVEDECQIRPPRYLRALHQACLDAGVEMIEHAPVSDLRTCEDSTEVLAGDRWHRSDAVIVCAGAWTGRVASCLRLEVGLVPIRGQILLLKTPTPLLHGVVNVGHRYIVCRDDGNTLVGSCEEEVGFELGTTEPVLDSLREFAMGLIPDLASAEPIDAWSGLRPLTFDGFPMIGRVPGTGNVYVAAGHYRSGLHLSPGTAVVLADLLEGRQPQISIESFGVGKQQSESFAAVEAAHQR